MKKAITVFIFLCALLPSFGQCTITSPRTSICKGDIIPFTFQGTKPVSSYQWYFGNGKSSTQANPSSSFPDLGEYTTKCEVTFTDGTSCVDSIKIGVFALPIANLSVDASSVFCESTNNICINDVSSTPSGKPIATRRFIWGDGAADLDITAAQMCHHFTDYATKTVRIEVADDIGCTSEATTTVSFRPEPNASLTIETTNEDCYKGVYCAVLSVPSTGIKTIAWQQNGQPITQNSNLLCFNKDKAFLEKFRVDVEDDFGCTASTTASISRTFTGQNGPAEIPIDTICYGDDLVVNLTHLPATNDSIELLVYSADFTEKHKEVIHPKKGDTTWSLTFRPDTIGVHYFKFTSLNAPDGCGYFETILAWVRGPYTRVGLANGSQCVNRDTVYFGDASGYFLNSSRIGYRWEFGDNEADNTMDLNPMRPYFNYGHSTSRNSMHFYPKIGCYNSSFMIVDSVYGCTGYAPFSVNTGYPALTDLSIIDQKDVYCEGDTVFYEIGLVRYKDQSIDPAHKKLPKSCVNPSSVLLESVDITDLGIYDGKLFFTFETDKQCEPEDMTLISGDGKKHYYPNGSKTPVYIHDTVCYAETDYPDNIVVDNVPKMEFDVLTTTPVGCDKIRVAVKIKSNEVLKRFKIKWTSQDSLVKDYGSLVMVDTIVKILMDTGSYVLTTHAFSSCGCETIAEFEFAEGLRSSINAQAACGGQFFSINGAFEYIDSSRIFTGDKDNENISWKFDTLDWVSNINSVVPYDTFGKFNLYLAYSDYSGNCTDTISKVIDLKKVDAKFSSTNETNICEKLIQFSDRSVVQQSGEIVKWEWDLDNGFESTLENPYQYYKRKGLYNITLTAYSKEGCKDTATKTINLEGPVPLFDFITDTIGCYPLVVGFVNKSKNAKAYLWEWNDHNGATEVATPEQDTMYFSYAKPGLFYPALRAFDTVYNGSNYYICDDIYPNEEIEDPIRTVEVIDSVFLKFQLPNMICQGDPMPILNLTGQPHLNYYGIGSDTSREFGANTSATYITNEDTGEITFRFYARAMPSSKYPACSDTFSKTVYIDHVKADFEHCTRFTPKDWTAISTDNNSNYRATKFLWTDTQDKLLYDEEEPKIKFFGEWGDGYRELCLTAISDFGCRDSICKIVQIPKLEKYNVFTPENDGYNNTFDIDIEFERTYSLKIYNRYGELVFESDQDGVGDSPQNWNGRFKNTGKELPEGTYFYVLRYSFATCREKEYIAEGTVDIIRSR